MTTKKYYSNLKLNYLYCMQKSWLRRWIPAKILQTRHPAASPAAYGAIGFAL